MISAIHRLTKIVISLKMIFQSHKCFIVDMINIIPDERFTCVRVRMVKIV